ncbi:MAG: heavy-metal-associated domain-containing protein [Spirochaetes bacterium]|nr:heavy-metal-associated domain-containing protein [Spirochaetota bacterium]
MRKILTALDMSCDHCKMTIEKAVKELSGITQVNADPDTKKITIDFDEHVVSLDDIKGVIIEAGYNVDE